VYEPDERLAPEVTAFPPGVAESSHAFGPYLYREDEIILVAPSPQERVNELARLGTILGDRDLQRRLFWDVALTRFFGEFPPEHHDEPPSRRQHLVSLLRALWGLVKLVLVALPRGLRLPIEIAREGRTQNAVTVLRLRPVPGVPDLVPALVQRVLRYSPEPPLRVSRFTGRAVRPARAEPRGAPTVTPHHVFWTAPHPIGFSAAPPRPSDADPPGLPPFDEGASNPVLIAVLDNGVDRSLPWFVSPAAVQLLDPQLDAADPGPRDGSTLDTFACHGTFVAGVALAEAYRDAGEEEGRRPVRIVSIRVSDPTGYISDQAAADGLHRLGKAVATGALRRPDVVLMAFGGYVHDGLSPAVPLVQDAVRSLVADDTLAGTVFAASAGNEGMSQEVYPAALDEPRVIGVGATAGSDPPARADFSNLGPWVHACASGRNILGPFTPATDVFLPEVFDGPTFGPLTFRGMAVWSGTSMSAALVAGRLAAEVAAGRAATGEDAWVRLATSGTPRVEGIGYSLVVLPEQTAAALRVS
jgi:Subtilase family